MAGSWIRLEGKMMAVGWTSRLPGQQYAAFVKLLQAVKMYGMRGGRIRKNYFDDEQLETWCLSRNAFDSVISLAIKHGAITVDADGIITVTNWNKYQLDPTIRQRVARHREKDVTVSNGCNVGNGCNDDVTGRDVTGRDGTDKPCPPPPEVVDDQDKPPEAKSTTLHQEFIEWFCGQYKTRTDLDYDFQGGKDGKAVKLLLEKYTPIELQAMTAAMFDDQWGFENASPAILYSSRNKWRQGAHSNGKPAANRKGSSLGPSATPAQEFDEPEPHRPPEPPGHPPELPPIPAVEF